MQSFLVNGNAGCAKCQNCEPRGPLHQPGEHEVADRHTKKEEGERKSNLAADSGSQYGSDRENQCGNQGELVSA